MTQTMIEPNGVSWSEMDSRIMYRVTDLGVLVFLIKGKKYVLFPLTKAEGKRKRIKVRANTEVNPQASPAPPHSVEEKP